MYDDFTNYDDGFQGDLEIDDGFGFSSFDPSGNMPCDTFGPCACSESCPKYFECHK